MELLGSRETRKVVPPRLMATGVLMLVTGLLVLLPRESLAGHGACELQGSDFYISGRNDVWLGFQGTAGSVKVRNLHLEAFGGLHVESMYIWADPNNWIEYGWYVDRATFFTGPKTLFNARRFSGVYSGPGGDGVGDNLKTLSLADYRFKMYREPSDDRWHFSWRQPPSSTTENFRGS